jgi:hypothetical protein
MVVDFLFGREFDSRHLHHVGIRLRAFRFLLCKNASFSLAIPPLQIKTHSIWRFGNFDLANKYI